MLRNQTIIVARASGLCNRLTIVANAIAYGLEYGSNVSCPALTKFADDYENLRDNMLGVYPPPVRPMLIDRVPGITGTLRATRLFQHLGDGLMKLNRHSPFAIPNMVLADTKVFKQHNLDMDDRGLRAIIDDTPIAFLRCWDFRCPQLVMRHASAIRSYFKPNAHIEREAEGIVARLGGKADLVIGTHIRQGDYRKFKNGRYFYSIPQYHAWMSQFAEALKPQTTAFLVCSDADLNAEQFPDLTVDFGPGYPAGDIEALSRCDRIIGPLSTFNHWASFYGDTPLCLLDTEGEYPWQGRFAVSDLNVVP